MKNKLFLVPCFFMVYAKDEESAITRVGEHSMEFPVCNGIHFRLDESLPVKEVADDSVNDWPETMKGVVKGVPYTVEDFCRGNLVNVKASPVNDVFDSFTGRVKGPSRGRVLVENEETGEQWECDPEQLSYCSDEVMHENA
jgi:hypothetical protein